MVKAAVVAKSAVATAEWAMTVGLKQTKKTAATAAARPYKSPAQR